jgi:hypothetical protein
VSHAHDALQSTPLRQAPWPVQFTSHAPLPQVTPPAHAPMPSHAMLQSRAAEQSTPSAQRWLPVHVTSQFRSGGHTTVSGQSCAFWQSITHVPPTHDVHTAGQAGGTAASTPAATTHQPCWHTRPPEQSLGTSQR